MASVRSLKNQYRGVNAHLHSHFQSESGWNSFHSNHIADLTRLMRASLLPMGYTADTEQSLQIRRYGEPIREPVSDVLIYDADPLRSSTPFTIQGDTYELTAALPVVLGLTERDIQYHRAVGVYQIVEGQKGYSPVAWVELLSPSNKPGGQDAGYYREKREALLQTGIVFVEIDYLHESSTTLAGIPNYRTRPKRPAQQGAHAYRIAVIDPRPTFLEGRAQVSQFDVDDSLPTVTIPLHADDVLTFDFNPAYTKTFDEMLYGNEIDYAQPPLNFDRYSADDQQRILNRMLHILRAFQAGDDLTSPPAKIDLIPLNDAVQQLETLKQMIAPE